MKKDTWDFVEKTIEEMRINEDRFSEATGPLLINPDSPLIEPFGGIQILLIESLKKIVNDKHDIIKFYVYDSDYGRNECDVLINGNTEPFDSIETLKRAISQYQT